MGFEEQVKSLMQTCGCDNDIERSIVEKIARKYATLELYDFYVMLAQMDQMARSGVHISDIHFEEAEIKLMSDLLKKVSAKVRGN